MATVAVLTAAALSVGAVPPASARQDPGPPPTRYRFDAQPFRCPVERIGAQVVRCDNLSGAGAEAPLGLPEQR